MKLLWLICMIGLYNPVPAMAQTTGMIVGAGYQVPIPLRVVSKQVITVYATGIGEGITARVSASQVPWPTELAGISAEMRFGQALGIGQVEPVSTCPTYFQNRPLEVTENCGRLLAVTMQLGGLDDLPGAVQPEYLLFLKEKGVRTRGIELFAQRLGQFHILNSCDTAVRREVPFPAGGVEVRGLCRTIAVRSDGTVSSPHNPAKTGEVITVYAIGELSDGFWVDFRYGRDASVSLSEFTNRLKPEYIGPAPGQAGLSQVNIRIPTPPGELPACGFRVVEGIQVPIESNLAIAIGGPRADPRSFESFGICVDPGSRQTQEGPPR